MMQIEVKVNAAAAIRAGKTQIGTFNLEITDEDLAQFTPAQRNLLAAWHDGAMGLKAAGYTHYSPVEASLKELIKMIDAALAAEAAKKEEKEKISKKYLRDYLNSSLKGELFAEDSPLKEYEVIQLNYEDEKMYREERERRRHVIEENNNTIAMGLLRSLDLETVNSDSRCLSKSGKFVCRANALVKYLPPEEAKALETAIEAGNKKLEAEKDAEEAAKKAAIKAENEAKKAERQLWIEAHGSVHLKRLVVEEIPCDETYRNERLSKERPGWQFYGDICGEVVDCRDATSETIAALDEAREGGIECAVMWLAEGGHVCDRDERYECSQNFEEGFILSSEFLGKKIVKILL